MILTLIRLVFFLILVPFCIGLIPQWALRRIRQTFILTYLAGLLTSLALFEVVSIPCMILIEYGSFSATVKIYTILSLLLAAVGVVVCLLRVKRYNRIALVRRTNGSRRLSLKEDIKYLFPGEVHADAEAMMNPRNDIAAFRHIYSREAVVYWILFGAILIFQLFMAFTHSSFDGDDSYYVVESVLAQQADVMNTILPYTGGSTALDIRHALSVITMWEAYQGQVAGVHATILVHTLLPILLIPLTYMIYLEVGRILLRGRQEMLPIFMIFMALLQMFGYVSMYTSETFFLTRTWQGKSLIANFVLPTLFLCFLWIAEDIAGIGRKRFDGPTRTMWRNTPGAAFLQATRRNSPWIIMAMVNMVSGICSSMGMLLATGLIMAFTLVMLVKTRRWGIIPCAVLACVPNAIYLMLYLSIWIL